MNQHVRSTDEVKVLPNKGVFVVLPKIPVGVAVECVPILQTGNRGEQRKQLGSMVIGRRRVVFGNAERTPGNPADPHPRKRPAVRGSYLTGVGNSERRHPAGFISRVAWMLPIAVDVYIIGQ